MTGKLSATEMAVLNRALAKRTGGRVRVGLGTIGVAQGIALINATTSFASGAAKRQERGAGVGDGNADPRRAKLRRALRSGAVLAATMTLGACATFGGNVKGEFSCRAPDGICAPTSTIDDAALALIGGDGDVTKAGPFTPEAARPRVIQTTASEPVRSGEKVLRIVFPAHIDEAGRYRESTAIHAVVERGAWLAGATGASEPVRTSDARGQGDLASTDAPLPGTRSLGELASAAPEVRFPDPVAAIDAQNANVEKSAAATAAKTNVSSVGKAARGSQSAALVARVSAGGAVRPDKINASATIGSLHNPVLPKAATATGGADPMEKIRAQVAEHFGSATPRIGSTQAAPSQTSGAAASTTAGSVPAKPLNGPSLFPVSEVNR